MPQLKIKHYQKVTSGLLGLRLLPPARVGPHGDWGLPPFLRKQLFADQLWLVGKLCMAKLYPLLHILLAFASRFGRELPSLTVVFH